MAANKLTTERPRGYKEYHFEGSYIVLAHEQNVRVTPCYIEFNGFLYPATNERGAFSYWKRCKHQVRVYKKLEITYQY